MIKAARPQNWCAQGGLHLIIQVAALTLDKFIVQLLENRETPVFCHIINDLFDISTLKSTIH